MPVVNTWGDFWRRLTGVVQNVIEPSPPTAAADETVSAAEQTAELRASIDQVVARQAGRVTEVRSASALPTGQEPGSRASVLAERAQRSRELAEAVGTDEGEAPLRAALLARADAEEGAAAAVAAATASETLEADTTPEAVEAGAESRLGEVQARLASDTDVRVSRLEDLNDRLRDTGDGAVRNLQAMLTDDPELPATLADLRSRAAGGDVEAAAEAHTRAQELAAGVSPPEAGAVLAGDVALQAAVAAGAAGRAGDLAVQLAATRGETRVSEVLGELDDVRTGASLAERLAGEAADAVGEAVASAGRAAASTVAIVEVAAAAPGTLDPQLLEASAGAARVAALVATGAEQELVEATFPEPSDVAPVLAAIDAELVAAEAAPPGSALDDLAAAAAADGAEPPEPVAAGLDPDPDDVFEETAPAAAGEGGPAATPDAGTPGAGVLGRLAGAADDIATGAAATDEAPAFGAGAGADAGAVAAAAGAGTATAGDQAGAGDTLGGEAPEPADDPLTHVAALTRELEGTLDLGGDGTSAVPDDDAVDDEGPDGTLRSLLDDGGAE